MKYAYLLERLNRAQFSALLVVTAFALTASLWMLTVQPALAARAELRAEHDSLKLVDPVASARQLDSVPMVARLKAINQKLYGAEGSLSPEQLEADVIGRLQTLSWTHNVRLQAIQPRQGDVVDGFQETNFSVSLIGRYPDLYRWLTGIDSELGFIVIKDYRMEPVGSNNAASIAVAVTLATYRSVQ